jgi:hypothetical protein
MADQTGLVRQRNNTTVRLVAKIGNGFTNLSDRLPHPGNIPTVKVMVSQNKVDRPLKMVVQEIQLNRNFRCFPDVPGDREFICLHHCDGSRKLLDLVVSEET